MKRASDSFLGVPSQCFVTRKASIGVPAPRGRPQYCSNIAMKVGYDNMGSNVRECGVFDCRAVLVSPRRAAACSPALISP